MPLGPPSPGVYHDVDGSSPVRGADRVPGTALNMFRLMLSFLQMIGLRPSGMGRDPPKATEPLSSKWDETWLHPLHSAGSSCESWGTREGLCCCPVLGKSLHLSEPQFPHLSQGALPQGTLLRVL